MAGFQMDPLYWLILGPALLFMMVAQWLVRSTFSRWDKVRNQRAMTGAEVASRLLAQNGMSDVQVGAVQGMLTDHYNPRNNILNLSQATVNDASIAAMAVTAHEVGHAHQDASNSALMRLRTGIVPIVNFGSQLGPILFILGLTMQFDLLLWIGIALFSLAFVFALVTLPVELNASRRAMTMLEQDGLISTPEDRKGARAVLNAAALTYVAGMLTALFQVIYYITLALRGRRPERDGPN